MKELLGIIIFIGVMLMFFADQSEISIYSILGFIFTIIGIAIALGVLFFIWALLDPFISSASDKEKRKTYQKKREQQAELEEKEKELERLKNEIAKTKEG